MPIRIYNTLTGKREDFVPLQNNKVTMYACGVTVYDLCHIGHAMQALIYDVIRNYLKYRGYSVVYIRNYTDIDDKILNRAAELGIPALTHSQNMIAESDKDMASLGIAPADIQPKVSEHIPDIISLIETLISKNAAYTTPSGDVYFSVRNFADYGKLSNRNIDELEEGARIQPGEEKKDPADFALWKAMKSGENIGFDSPWGKGRPGWHIECSAMSMRYLGETFDIHGGGRDLVFPHHENEIAQSEAATGKPFAKYFIHNGLVTVNKQKMSKSLGNFMTIKDAVAKYHPEAIRFVILSNHYSSNIDFSEQQFEDAYKRIDYFYSTISEINKLESLINPALPLLDEFIPGKIVNDFIEAMDDNFNTAKALANLSDAFAYANELMGRKGLKQKNKIPTLLQWKKEIMEVGTILNLFCTEPVSVIESLKQRALEKMNITRSLVEDLINRRNDARANKDFGESDRIRDELLAMNVLINDTPTGTEWKIKW